VGQQFVAQITFLFLLNKITNRNWEACSNLASQVKTRT
jgi:hypothetical protein